MNQPITASAVIWISCLILPVVGDTVDESTCRALPCSFATPGTLPKTALASFQGSGNTWMRQILAKLTGYKTGDRYISYGDDQFPEFSSRDDNTVIAIKTHQYYPNLVNEFDQAVVVLRHPLRSLLSEFNRMYGGNKTGEADISHFFDSEGLPTWKWDVWMAYMASLQNFYEFWLKDFQKPVLFICYDNLKRDMGKELQRILQFYRMAQNDMRMSCILRYPQGYFIREHSQSKVDRKKLFKLSLHKADQVLSYLKSLVLQRFTEASYEYQSMNVTVHG